MPVKASYNIEFTGELMAGMEQTSVCQKLAKYFAISESELLPIFEGKLRFVRNGLNQQTAELYQKRFARAGAVCRMLEQETAGHTATPAFISDAVIPSSDSSEPSCPKCHSTNVDALQCHDCGIYIEKYRAQQQRLETEPTPVNQTQTESDDVDIETLDYRRKAIRIIKYTLYYLIAVFILDNYLEDYRSFIKFILTPGLQVSYLFYLLGHIGLAFGCYYLALAKGRSGLWGLMGLLSLPGLASMLLLRDRYSGFQPIEPKIRIGTYMVIVSSIYWVINATVLYNDETEFVNKGLTLREGRSEYPSRVEDTDETLYVKEIEELNKYIAEGIELISGDSFNYKQVVAMGDAMLSEVHRLFIWINYQQFLQYRQGKQGIEFLEKKNIRKQHQEFFKSIQEAVLKTGNPDLKETFKGWFLGGAIDYDEAMFYAVFFKDEFDVTRKIRELGWINKLPYEPPEFSLLDIDLPKHKPTIISKVQIDSEYPDTIAYTFTENKYTASGRTLVFGYFYTISQKYDLNARKKVDEFRLNKVLISPDFPTQLITNDDSVLPLADTIPFIDKGMK